MISTLPGSTIEADLSRDGCADAILTPLFLAGGLSLSQVSQLTGLENYIIQNWVKRGFVSPPVKKTYSRNQFCRIAFINMLKDSLQLDQIARLIGYINGRLSDEADDLIGDSTLYGYFCVLAAEFQNKGFAGIMSVDEYIKKALKGYNEPYKGSRERLGRVLRIMAVAYCSGVLKQQAEREVEALDGHSK